MVETPSGRVQRNRHHTHVIPTGKSEREDNLPELPQNSDQSLTSTSQINTEEAMPSPIEPQRILIHSQTGTAINPPDYYH